MTDDFKVLLDDAPTRDLLFIRRFLTNRAWKGDDLRLRYIVNKIDRSGWRVVPMLRQLHVFFYASYVQIKTILA